MHIPSRVILRNLAILAFGALPLAIALVWLQMLLVPLEWMQDREGAQSLFGYFLGLVFWMLVLILPVLVGGVLHQVILYLIPGSWTRTQRRLGILVSTPVVLLGLVLIGNSPEALLQPRAILPIAGALILYGLLAQPIRELDP